MFSSLNSCLYKHFPLYTHNEYTQTKKKKNSKKAEVRARWPWVGLRAACSQGELKKKKDKNQERIAHCSYIHCLSDTFVQGQDFMCLRKSHWVVKKKIKGSPKTEIKKIILVTTASKRMKYSGIHVKSAKLRKLQNIIHRKKSQWMKKHPTLMDQ